ncbi:MAG: hypothetical protein F4138_07755 [Acidimicrobiia bacterium]|nr:hypothetical protein [Acidimicrobiia bacterium]
MDQRGSISVLAAALLGIVAMGIVLFGQLGAQGVRRARAVAVADLVAMAAAAEPQATRIIAEINNASLVKLIVEPRSIAQISDKIQARQDSFSQLMSGNGFSSTVVIRYDGVMAEATAELLMLN